MIRFKTLLYNLERVGSKIEPRNAFNSLPRSNAIRSDGGRSGASLAIQKERKHESLNRGYLNRGYKVAWILGALIVPQVCAAEAWLFKPSIGLELGYYDNFELLLTPKGDTSSTRLLAGTELSRLTDTLEVRGRIGLDAVTYTETFNDTATTTTELRDQNNFLGEFSWHQKGEISDFNMNAVLKQDSILRTVKSEGFDPDDLEPGIGEGDIDEAIIQQDVTRRRLDVRPRWSRKLADERSKVTFDYRFSGVDYEQVEGVNLSNFQQHRVAGRYSNRLSERSTASINVGASLFLPDTEVNRKTISANVGTGLRYAWSETLDTSFTIGARQSTLQSDTMEDSNTTGFTSRIAFIKNFELTRWTASLNHSLQPSGSGAESEVNELRFSSFTRVSPKVDFSLSTQYFESSPLDGTDANVNNQNNRTFFVFNTSAIWKFTEFWSLSGSYRYRQQERNVEDNTIDNLAEGNSVFLTLRWSKAANLD